MEDCDLHAIVRGYGGRSDQISANMTDMENISPSYSNLSNKPADDLVCCFTQLYQFTMGLDERFQQPYRLRTSTPVLSPLSTQTIHTNFSLPNENTVSRKSRSAVLPDSVRINEPRKGKKNKKLNVVKHVTAESPRSDAWAWRKYGQKPIKGSPYPRSYYRCSSSKGCLARKQVERSSLDPAVFIVTYTAEHSHPHPTRKNSSSGRTGRKKRFRISSGRPDSTDGKGTAEPQSYSEWVPSPIAGTIPVIDKVLVDKESLKNGGSRVMNDIGQNFNYFMHETDANVDDGWFQSIEEVNGGLAEQLLSVDDYFMYPIYDFKP